MSYKAGEELEVEETSVSSFVVNLISAVILGIFVAVIAMFIITALWFFVAMNPEAQQSSTDNMVRSLASFVILLVTGLIYYGMFRKMRKLMPRKKQKTEEHKSPDRP